MERENKEGYINGAMHDNLKTALIMQWCKAELAELTASSKKSS